MSSSGVRDIEDSNDRLKKVILGKDESLVDSYKVFDEASSISALAGGGTQSQGEGSAPGNFMLISGTNWTGRYGHLEEIATIENGLINISRNADNDVTNEASSPMIILNPEGGVADFLDTMLQGSDVLHYPIQYIKIAQGVATITLRPPLLLSITNVVGDGATTTITVTVADTSELTTGDTVDISNTTNFNIDDTVITVTGGTTFTCTLDDTGSATSESSGDVDRGNLSLPNDANFDAEADTFLVFIYDLVNQLWSLQSASNALGSGTSGDPTVLDNLDSVDHGTIGAISESFDLEEGNFHFFEASGDVSITFTNLPVSGKWEPILLKITQDNTGSHDITFTQTIENGSPTIDTTADTITVVKFYMYNDGTSDIIRQGDWDASAGGLNTNLSNLSTPTIPTVDLSMNGQAIDNILSLDIEDSAGDTKLGISGPLGVGARFSFVSGDTVFFTEGVTDILSITAAGLNLLTHDLTMGTGGNIVGGGASEGMTNIGHLDFVDNLATPSADISLYSDGTDLFTKSDIDMNSNDIKDISSLFFILSGQSIIFDSIGGLYSVPTGDIHDFSVDGTRLTISESAITASTPLDMNSNNITNASYIESDTANRPGSGFIRMATTDEIRMRNVGNDDDIIIQSGTDALGNDAVIFNIAGADQMTMSNLNLDLLQNNLKGVGNITPASASSTDVGDSGTPFLRMFADFFIPDPATIITSRYALAKTGNQLYVNYDSTNADAGFGVYEQGIQQFRFYNPTISETELQFGPDIFESSETYRIVFGANSAAKGLIEYTDAGDLILERTSSTSTTDGVILRTGGIDYLYATSTDVSILNTKLNLNSNEIENVVNITSNGSGGATTGTIGELITSDGGFNYFMRDTLAWESDEDTKLTMSSTGITLETNDASDDIAITAAGSTSDITLTATGTITYTVSSTFIQVADGVITFDGGNVFLTNDAEYIGFLDATDSSSIDTPIAGDINLFNNSDDEILSVKKNGSFIHQVENIANLSDVANQSNHWVRLPIVDSTTNISSVSILVIEAVAGNNSGAMCLYTNSVSPTTEPFLLIKANFYWYYLEIGTLVGSITTTGRRLADIPFTPTRQAAYVRDDATTYDSTNWPGQVFPGVIALAATTTTAANFWMREEDGTSKSEAGTFKVSQAISAAPEPGITTTVLPVTSDSLIDEDAADELGGPDDGSCCISNDDFYCKLNGYWFRQDF